METCPCKKTFTIPEDPYFIYLYYAGPSYKRKHLGSLRFRYRQVSLYFSQKPATVPCLRIPFMYCSETHIKRSLRITEICLQKNIFRVSLKGTIFKRKIFGLCCSVIVKFYGINFNTTLPPTSRCLGRLVLLRTGCYN